MFFMRRRKILAADEFDKFTSVVLKNSKVSGVSNGGKNEIFDQDRVNSK